jgi:modification methylase
MSELPDKTVDLIITSPPYNKGFFNKCKNSNQIWNGFEINYNTYDDNMSIADYEKWMCDFFNLCSRVLKDNGSLFFNHKPIRYNNKIYHPMEFILKSDTMEVYQEIIWNRKNSPNIRNDIFIPCTERIYWMKRKGDKPKFNRNLLDKQFCGEVWEIIAKKNKLHPAPFPEELVRNCMLPFIDKKIVVMDPFMGCGTTGIVAKELGVDFIGIELDKEYFNISNKRINNIVIDPS